MKLFCTLFAGLITIFSYSQILTLEADIIPGSGSSSPTDLTEYKGKLYFWAKEDSTSPKLWSYDGTVANKVSNIKSGTSDSYYSRIFKVYQDKLYMNARDSINKLFVFNGDSITLIEDLVFPFYYENPLYFTEYNGILYFSAIKGDTSGFIGRELLATNGDSVYVVADLFPGGSSSPSHLFVYNNKLFFRANAGMVGRELYSFNGDSVKLEADINPGLSSSQPQDFVEFGGKLYFSATSSSGREIWKFDGTNASLLADLNPGPGGSNPFFHYVYNGAMYFSADTGNSGTELWRFDGVNFTEFDMNLGTGDFGPRFFQTFDSTLYFSYFNCANNYGLQCYPNNLISFDGDTTFQNATSIFQFKQPRFLTEYDGRLFFRADDGNSGVELWSLRTDTPCFKPVNLKAANPISAGNKSKASLSWDIVQNAVSYIVNGGILGTAEDSWVTFPFSSTSLTATDLSEACYVWRVRSVCANDTSGWSEKDTFCIPPCAPPSNLKMILGNDIIFTWDLPASSKVAYLLEAKINTSGWSGSFKDTIAPGTTTSVSYPYTGVPPGQYKWRMLTGCNLSPLRISPYSPVDLFTLPAISQKFDIAKIEVTPNPAGNFFQISVPFEFKDDPYTLFIYNINGELVYETISDKNDLLIETGFLSPALYFIEVRNKRAVITDKLIIIKD